MVNASSLDDRPRFGLLDLFAIVAGIGITLAEMKDDAEFSIRFAQRTQLMSSYTSYAKEIDNAPVEWNAARSLKFLLFASPLGMLLAQPLGLALQFVPRRRRMPVTRVEWIGVAPSFLVLSAVALRFAALSPYRAILLGPLAVLILGLLLSAVWLFCNRPGDRYSNGMTWTDAIGLATFWLGVPILLFSGLTIAAELSR
jgi:hypothetical protein